MGSSPVLGPLWAFNPLPIPTGRQTFPILEMRKLRVREASSEPAVTQLRGGVGTGAPGLATVIVLILGKRQGFCSALQDNQLCGPLPLLLSI